MNKLVLIDGNSLINRGFYATPLLTTTDGTPVNAVYAFINMLIKIISDIKPTHILVAFDRKEPTFRHLMYSDYKGTRKPMPEELRPQIPLLKEVLDAMGIARYEQAGIEADDIIGTLAKKYDFETIIITGDKDSFQLVDDTTSVYFTKRGITELDVYNASNFEEKTGVAPKQIVDLKAMMGDASDNIPGIEGVGSVTAVKLVQTYGTLENLYAHTDEIKGKLQEKILASKDVAALSKRLATIDVGATVTTPIEDMTYTFPFGEKAKEIFSRLEFRALLKKTEIYAAKESFVAEKDSIAMPNLVTVKTSDDFTPTVKHCKIAVNIGENIDFYDGDTEFKFVIKANFFDEGLSYGQAFDCIKKYLTDEKFTVIVYSKKDFISEVEKSGLAVKAVIEDVSLQKYILESSPSVPLADVMLTAGVSADYSAYYLFTAFFEFDAKLKERKMYSLYADLELPLVDVLSEMENNGFKIDLSMLEELSVKYDAEIKELLAKIRDIAGEDFNPNSPKQLGEVLFDKLGLKSGKKNSRGYSTSAEVLESLENEHEIIPLILKYRQISKLKSTYVDGFKRLIDPKSGVVHTTFYQTLTTTGRLSSREPNLQNIPVREAEGRELRKLFVPSFENGKIVSADYSQIELRLLAHFSGSEKLVEAYKTEKDIHALTASQVFSVPIDEVTPSMRRSAKAVNFGIIYGISDFGLAKQLKIPVKRAKEYIERYFAMYPGVKEYMDKNVEFAKKNGYVETLLGRKRYIREINSPNYSVRSFGERAAMNMPLQGTAADIIKIAMIKVYDRMKSEKLKSKLILQVHDELIVDASYDEVEAVKRILTEEMENAVTLTVPLKADAACGERWFDAK